MTCAHSALPPPSSCAAAAVVWAQLMSVMVPTAGMLLVQARAYGAYRARLVTHWARLVEEQQQQQQQQQQLASSGSGAAAHTHALACVLAPPPNSDEWEYDAALRGEDEAKRLDLALVACAAVALVWLAAW